MGGIPRSRIQRLDTQGCDCLPIEQIESFYPWQRLAYALCVVLTFIALAMGSSAGLWAMAVVAGLAAIQPVHPFDLIYNHGIRHLTGGGKIPPRAPPARFACGIAAFWVAGTGYAMHVGATTVAYALGAPLLIVGGLVGTIDFCIPSNIWRAIFGPPKPRAG